MDAATARHAQLLNQAIQRETPPPLSPDILGSRRTPGDGRLGQFSSATQLEPTAQELSHCGLSLQSITVDSPQIIHQQSQRVRTPRTMRLLAQRQSHVEGTSGPHIYMGLLQRRLQITLPACSEPIAADGGGQAAAGGNPVPNSASNGKQQTLTSIQPFAVQDQQIQNALDLVDCESVSDFEKSQSIDQVLGLLGYSKFNVSDLEGLMSLKLRVLELVLNENKYKKGVIETSDSSVSEKLSKLLGDIRRQYFELLDKDEAKAHNVQARLLTKIYEAHFDVEFFLSRERAQQLGWSLVLSNASDPTVQGTPMPKKSSNGKKLIAQLKLLITLQTDISAQFPNSSGTLEAMCQIVSLQMTKLTAFIFAKTRSSMTFSQEREREEDAVINLLFDYAVQTLLKLNTTYGDDSLELESESERVNNSQSTSGLLSNDMSSNTTAESKNASKLMIEMIERLLQKASIVKKGFLELQRKDEEEFKRVCSLIKQEQSHTLLRLLKQIVKSNILSSQPSISSAPVVYKGVQPRNWGGKVSLPCASEKSLHGQLSLHNESSTQKSRLTHLDDYPDGQSMQLLGINQDQESDFQFQQIFNDEEEVPEPMPIAFIAAPEAQGSETEDLAGKSLTQQRAYFDNILSVDEVSTHMERMLSQHQVDVSHLRTQGKLRSPQLQEAYTSGRQASLIVQKLSPPKSQVDFINRKKMFPSHVNDKHDEKGSGTYGEEMSGSINGDILQQAQPVTSIVNYVVVEPEEPVSPSRIKSCLLEVTVKTRVAHNIKEHKFVDRTVNENRQAEPVRSLYHTDVRSSKLNEPAPTTALQSLENMVPQLDESKLKPEITDKNKAPLPLLVDGRSQAWLGFLGIPQAAQADFKGVELLKDGRPTPMTTKLQQALVSKTTKTRSTSSRIGKLKFLEFAPGILEGFILPYICAYSSHVDLKSLNIDKCRPNAGLMDVLQQFLLVSASSDKIQARVNDDMWKQIVRAALQHQLLANIDCQKIEIPCTDTTFSDISEILVEQYEIPFKEVLQMFQLDLLDLIGHVDTCNSAEDFLGETSGVCSVIQIIQILTQLMITLKQTTEETVSSYLRLIMDNNVWQQDKSLLNHWHIQVRRASILSVVDLLYTYKQWVSKVTQSSLDDGQRQIVNIYLSKKEAETKVPTQLKIINKDQQSFNQNEKSGWVSEFKPKVSSKVQKRNTTKETPAHYKSFTLEKEAEPHTPLPNVKKNRVSETICESQNNPNKSVELTSLRSAVQQNLTRSKDLLSESSNTDPMTPDIRATPRGEASRRKRGDRQQFKII